MRLRDLAKRVEELAAGGSGRTALFSDDRDGFVLPANSIDDQVYLGEMAQFVAGHTYVTQLYWQVQQPAADQMIKLRLLTSVQMIGNLDPDFGEVWEDQIPAGSDVIKALKTEGQSALAVTGGNALFALFSYAAPGSTPEPLVFDVFRFRVYDLGAL